MNNLNLAAQEYKQKMPDIEKLDGVGGLSDVKSDAEEQASKDVDIENFRQFRDSTKVTYLGHISDVNRNHEKSKKYWKKVKQLEDDDNFQKDKKQDVIRTEHWELLKDAYEHEFMLSSKKDLIIWPVSKTLFKLFDVVDTQLTYKQWVNSAIKELLDEREDFHDDIESSLEHIEAKMEEEPDLSMIEQKIDQLEKQLENISVEGEVQPELKSKVNQLSDKIEQISDKLDSGDTENESGEDEEPEELPENYQKLYDLVQQNPEKDQEWYLDQFDKADRIVKSWATKISQDYDGYSDFSLDTNTDQDRAENN